MSSRKVVRIDGFCMKRFLVFVFLLFASFSVFAREKEVKVFLENVYADVVGISKTMTGDYECLVEKYCSSSFRFTYEKVRRLEEKNGEIVLHSGGGAYDLFVECQDYFESVVYDVEKVERVATASDNVYCAIVVARFSCDSYEEKEWSFKRYVYVVDENGELRISDFKTPGEKSDYEIMRKVLSVL